MCVLSVVHVCYILACGTVNKGYCVRKGALAYVNIC